MIIGFFDLETTGLQIDRDQIVEITIIVEDQQFTSLVRPTISISPKSSEVHGIFSKDVADESSFKEIAPQIIDLLDSCDIICGYNLISYDIPLLNNEFKRNGFSFSLDKPVIDLYRSWLVLEKNKKLGACYLRYTGKELDNAHSSLYDVKACLEILEKQLETHNLTHEELIRISSTQNEKEVSNKMKFGKWKGNTMEEIFEKDKSYLIWMYKQEWTKEETKELIKKLFKDND